MSKKTTLDAVAAAISEQIATYRRPLVWRVETAKSILKIKEKAPKDIVTPKTAEELQSEIIAALSTYVGKQGVRKLQGIISGSVNLNEVVSGIATSTITKAEQVKAEAATEDAYNALLAQMNKPQLFAMLDEAKDYTKPAKAAKATKADKSTKSGGYVSIPDKEAYEIACYYLENYSTDQKWKRKTLAPECLRGGRTANATMALRRFLFSTICRDLCSIYNSMPAISYEFYKNKPYIKQGEDAKSDLQELLREEPNLLAMIEGWKDEPYIKAVLSK